MTDTQTPLDLSDPSPLRCTGTPECPAEDHDPGCQTVASVPLANHLPVRTGAVGSVLGDLPVIPSTNETTAIAQLANTLAYANACPSALRGKPNDVFLVLLTARDLGVSLTTAMREFHVIEGKVTLSPKVKLAMVRQAGLGKIWPDPANDHNAATWHGERADMPGVVVSSTFTLADAKRAGMDGKQNWRNYPARMMSWRAVGYLLDDLFAEVGTGLYQPDELGAVTDGDGEPIDVQAVESLPGLRGGRAPAPPDPAVELGWPDGGARQEAWDDLRSTLNSLPADVAAPIREWVAAKGVKLATFTPEVAAELAGQVVDATSAPDPDPVAPSLPLGGAPDGPVEDGDSDDDLDAPF
jgi:hypothetical protein